MRKKQTFLITVMTPETNDASFCGKLKVIASGKTCNFTSLNEFYQVISAEISAGGENMVKPPEALRQSGNPAQVSNSLEPSGRQ
jgi:hypothetical protein